MHPMVSVAAAGGDVRTCPRRSRVQIAQRQPVTKPGGKQKAEGYGYRTLSSLSVRYQGKGVEIDVCILVA
jgi:hypothetical protein